jgi:hypothetical protein
MTMKALKKQFERTVKDISDDTTAFRVPINSDLAMVDWLVTNYKDYVDLDNVDNYHDADINCAVSLEAQLVLNQERG